MKCFITFGNDAFRNQKERLKREAESTGWFDLVVAESPETIQSFIGMHRDFFASKKRGFGYWIWKPYILLRQLNDLKEGDLLFYADAGASLLPHKFERFNEYVEVLGKKAIIVASESNYKERMFQKKKVIKRFSMNQMRLDEHEGFLESPQVEGGVFMCRKCDLSLSLVREWMDLVLEDGYGLINDDDDLNQLEGFVEGRHDQSILSILCKLNDTVIFGDGEVYGRGPFFSGRMTDSGPRHRAPDRFRMEPDYNPYKHRYIHDYLGDPNTKGVY